MAVAVMVPIRLLSLSPSQLALIQAMSPAPQSVLDEEPITESDKEAWLYKVEFILINYSPTQSPEKQRLFYNTARMVLGVERKYRRICAGCHKNAVIRTVIVACLMPPAAHANLRQNYLKWYENLPEILQDQTSH